MPKLEKNLLSQTKKYIADNDLIRAGDKVVVACSGGADSVSLLFLLKALETELKLNLIVAHFNHKLRGREADADEKFVSNLAKELNLKYLSVSAIGKIKNEEQAREKRYAFLNKVVAEERANKIALAHNLNDLSETMLLNLIRGTGIRGLYSLRPKRDKFVRPLLFAEKKDLLSYLKLNKISFREDSSNKNLVYTRNIMRHVVLPEIRKINPAVDAALARTSTLASIQDDFISDFSEKTLDKISQKVNEEIIINRKEFATLSPAVSAEIIRILAEKAGITSDLSFAQVAEVLGIISRNIGNKEKVIQGKLKVRVQTGKVVISTLGRKGV